MAIELTSASTSTLYDIREYTSFPSHFSFFPNGRFQMSQSSSVNFPTTADTGNTVDFSHPSCNKLRVVNIAGASSLTTIIGGGLLSDLENAGTGSAVNFSSCGFGAAAIDAFFTALPSTSKTATIRVVGCPGAATCTPSIATAKGYIVQTS